MDSYYKIIKESRISKYITDDIKVTSGDSDEDASIEEASDKTCINQCGNNIAERISTRIKNNFGFDIFLEVAIYMTNS